jgi:hypothetical protein
MKATAEEAGLHKRQRALAEVARLLFMVSVLLMNYANVYSNVDFALVMISVLMIFAKLT